MRTAPARPLRPRPLSRLRCPITAPCPASGANPPSTLAVSPSPFARLLSTYLLHRYPFRLCPRQPRPSYGAYDPALPLGAQQQCRAATGGRTCAGKAACALLGCTNKASALTSEGCHQCCGGTLHYSSTPCIFPFMHTDPVTGAAATRSTCAVSATVNTSAGVPLRWCPTAVDEALKPKGANGECSGRSRA